jgi:hypothetical protein
VILSLIQGVYRNLPMPVRKKISSLKKSCARLAARMRLKPIRVDACLLGGDDGTSAWNLLLFTLKRAGRSA